MKKVFLTFIIIAILISAAGTCFAADNAQYPVKVNIFKIDIDFSKEKAPQTISFKADSDIADQLYVEVVDTSFSLSGGKTIFTETSKNLEIEKYLAFTYNPEVEISENGADISITVTPNNLPDGVYYKGVKISHKTNTTISSILVPVVISNLTPGAIYNTSAKITYVGIDGDYVIKSPFEVCVGLLNDGDKPISNLSGELTITDAEGDVVGEYPITSNTIFFAGAPKEIRIPITDNLSDGTYTAKASIIYAQDRPAITGTGSFDVKKDFSGSVVKHITPAAADDTDKAQNKSIPERLTFAVVGALIVVFIIYSILVAKRKRKEEEKKENEKKENKKNE